MVTRYGIIKDGEPVKIKGKYPLFLYDGDAEKFIEKNNLDWYHRVSIVTLLESEIENYEKNGY